MKNVERDKGDLGEDIRKLFDGDPVSPDEFEDYRFLTVRPVNGERVKAGSFAVRCADGLVYRIGERIGQTVMLKEAAIRTNDDVHTLLYLLRQGQNTDGQYIWNETAAPPCFEGAQVIYEASESD